MAGVGNSSLRGLIARRVAVTVVLLWVVSLLVFAATQVLPGDTASAILGKTATPESLAQLRAQLGLNEPVTTQYLDWLGGVFTGDLGRSVVTGTPISAEIAQKAQVTVPLTLYSLVIALIVALPFGVLAAYRRRAAASRVLSVLGVVAAAVPVVWAGLIGIIVLSTWLGWLPSQGFPRSGWEDPGQALRSLLLPALTIGVIEGAMLLRFVRSATLQAVGQDYVRTAAAKGLTRTQALLRHGLPNVGLSIITVLGLQVAGIIVGAVVIEQLFGLPGIGRMLVTDVGNRDLPKVQGELLVLTGFVLLVGFVVDLVHRVIDPRQREAE